MIQNWTDSNGVKWAQKATIGDGMTGPPGLRYHGTAYKVLDPNFKHERITKRNMNPVDRRMAEMCERAAQVCAIGIGAAIIGLLGSAL